MFRVLLISAIIGLAGCATKPVEPLKPGATTTKPIGCVDTRKVEC